MGCDIHGVLQTRYTRKGEPKGEWQNICKIERDRNYNLFSFLADVRNDGGITPIDQPRGYPDDFVIDHNIIDPEYPDEGPITGVKTWLYNEIIHMGDDCDNHSASWFTLQELRAADWDQKIQDTGIIDRASYERMQRGEGFPTTWCGGIGGPNIKVINQAQLNDTSSEGWTHIWAQWESGDTVGDRCRVFRAWLAYMWVKYVEGYEDNIEARIVFDFDN